MSAKGTPQFGTLDGDPTKLTGPFAPERANGYTAEAERIQSGGLDDDPTDSGAPVKNRVPFKNLQGGR